MKTPTPMISCSDPQEAHSAAEQSSVSYRSLIDGMGGIASFTRGVSMLPLIRQGCGYVSVIKSEQLEIDDIVLFEQMRRGEKVNILHRLVEIRPDGTYVTRGDNCLYCEFIRRGDIMGRVDKIYWTGKGAGCSAWLMPRLLGAERDTQNGGFRISVDAPGYLRYVRLWNAIWPLRRCYYRLRGGLRRRLARIGWLRRLYHRLKG